MMDTDVLEKWIVDLGGGCWKRSSMEDKQAAAMKASPLGRKEALDSHARISGQIRSFRERGRSGDGTKVWQWHEV